MHRVVSASWMLVALGLMYHCWSGVEVKVCTTSVVPAVLALGTMTNFVSCLDVM